MSQAINPFDKIESVLVADCGTNTTRVVLVDVVDLAYRFVARGEAPSTLEAPFGDVTVGVINAISAIENISGRKLLVGGKLIIPQQQDGSGVDAFVASSSAAEPLRVVAAGLVRNFSSATAARASYSTYTTVLDTVSLDDYGDALDEEIAELAGFPLRNPFSGNFEFDPNDPEAEFSPFDKRKDQLDDYPPDPDAPKRSPRRKKAATKNSGLSLFRKTERRGWRERQIAKLRRLAPNVVVLSGGNGEDENSVKSLMLLVEVVLEAERQELVTSLATAEIRRPMTLIYAGDKASQERVLQRVAGQLEVFLVDNLRSLNGRESLLPLQRQLAALYQERLLPQLPGYRRMNELSAVPVNTSCSAVGLITQFLAKDITTNRVLTVDIGGANTALFYADNQNYSPMVRGGFGMGIGLSNVMAETTLDNLRRWLPLDDVTDDELIHYALNKTLRPNILPAIERELFIEGAYVREALRHSISELNRLTTGGYDFNRLIGVGGPLVNVPQWQAVLLLLDGLEPLGASDTGLVELDLDTTMLMAAAGTLARLNPNAASYLFRYDCLHRLGAVVVVQGEGTIGAAAAHVTMRRMDGRVREVTVPFGSLALLPLRGDERAGLEIKLASGFRLGKSEPGALVATSPGREITGGSLGLIIDARGRPIHFASDPAQRKGQVESWYRVYREALQQAEKEGTDNFAGASSASHPSQPVTALVATGGSRHKNGAANTAKAITAPLPPPMPAGQGVAPGTPASPTALAIDPPPPMVAPGIPPAPAKAGRVARAKSSKPAKIVQAKPVKAVPEKPAKPPKTKK